jgi:hypothetical protein
MSADLERIRRALLERLIAVGVAPDLNNDDAAVRAVCASLGISPEIVVRELTRMRLDQARRMMQRMGSTGVSPGMLTMLSASRDVLMRERASFEDAYRHRCQQNYDELVEEFAHDLGDAYQVMRERGARPAAMAA